MTEFENRDKTVYLVALSHGQVDVAGTKYLSIQSQERVIGTASRYEELLRRGYDPVVIFTGGMKSAGQLHTSELMRDFFFDLTGFTSQAIPLSNETDGNIRTCFQTLPNSATIEVLSNGYHNFGGRVRQLIDKYKKDREVKFLAIEELGGNYVDTNFIPVSLRFSTPIEAMQCILLPIAGKLGIDLSRIYGDFSKFRLKMNGSSKL
jgi:hypothetical protein